MRHINVEVEDEIYEAAKRAAKNDGVFLKKWIERQIVAGANGHAPRPVAKLEGNGFRERTAEPFEDPT